MDYVRFIWNILEAKKDTFGRNGARVVALGTRCRSATMGEDAKPLVAVA